MRSLQLASALVAAIGVLSAFIWFARYSPWAAERGRRLKAEQEQSWQERKKILQVWADELKDRESKQRQRADEDRKLNGRPQVADKPPYPKAEYTSTLYDFGTMRVNETKTHTFRIKNVGQAKLILSRGLTTIHAPPSTTVRSRRVDPGRTTEIEMNWTPREPAASFAMTTTVYTNDPLHPEIQFKVFGKVSDGKSQSRSDRSQ